MLNHLSGLYLTEMDVLDELDEIKICKKYKYTKPPTKEGESPTEVEVEGIHPTIINDFENLHPVYKTLPGWKKDITEIEEFDQLPENCKTLIKEIEKSSKVQVQYISVNSEEHDGLLRIMR
jgi:adenylosuccinate synthase